MTDMNGTRVIALLDRVAATRSKNEKQDILREQIEDPFLLAVLTWAYDPYITFGVTPPKVSALHVGSNEFDLGSVTIWKMLEQLSNRTLSGNTAKQVVEDAMSDLNTPGAELLWRILSKDMRAGFTEGTINKVRPGTINVFEVMLAHKFEEKRARFWPMGIEPKLDGVRALCIVSGGEATFYSRTGKPFPAMESLGKSVAMAVFNAMAKLVPMPADQELLSYWRMLGNGATLNGSIVLDGEIIVGSFNKTSGDVRRKSESADDAEYHIFDAIPYAIQSSAAKSFGESYVRRRGFIDWFVQFADTPRIKTTPTYIVSSVSEVYTYYERFRERGLEGAIVKPLDGIYEKRRSYGWLKMKAEESEDLVVTGAFEGEGKYAGSLGGLIVNRLHGGEIVEVRVGGGFSDQQRAEFWEAYQLDLARIAGHDAQPNEYQALGCELLGRMIEIQFHEVTPDGSLRHPRFLRFRDTPEYAGEKI